MTGNDIRKLLPDGSITEISKLTNWSMPVVKKVLDNYPECDDMKQMNEIVECAIKIIERERLKAEANKKTLQRMLNESSVETHLSE